jgi:hypothetical protein
VVGVPPDFLDVEVDVAAEVYRCVFLPHAEALVVLEGLKGSAVVAHVFEAPLDHDEVLEDLRRRTPIPVVLDPKIVEWNTSILGFSRPGSNRRAPALAKF